MNSFTIKDLEVLTGVKAHTIRVWEQRYRLLKPQRTKSNIRYYEASDLKMLLNAAFLKKCGYRISQISQLSNEEMRQKILDLSYPNVCEERFVNEMVKAMIDMDVAHFESILDNYILTKGVNKAVLQLIFPFLEKTGVLWRVDGVDMTREHIVSNIIRHKLIVAIESVYPRQVRPFQFLLFLPEGAFHELGLLYVYYLLKSRGFQVIYLGANIPVEKAAVLLEQKKIHYTYIHLTAGMDAVHSKQFINGLQKYFVTTPVIISGPATEWLTRQLLPAHVLLKTSLDETMQFIHQL